MASLECSTESVVSLSARSIMGVSMQPVQPSHRRCMIVVFSVHGQPVQVVEVSHAIIESGSCKFHF